MAVKGRGRAGGGKAGKRGRGQAKGKAKGKGKGKGKNRLVDEGLKRRWELAITRYRRARAEESAGWDERYEALGHILYSEPPYFLAGGYRSAAEFLKAEAPDQDRRSVRTYVRVARHFEPEDEVRHGITKLDAVLRYLEARAGGELGAAKIRLDRTVVRVPEGKSEKRVRFEEATPDQLRIALRAASGAQRGSKLPPFAAAVLLGLRKAGTRGVGVSSRRELLTLSSIAPARVRAVGKALVTMKLPDF